MAEVEEKNKCIVLVNPILKDIPSSSGVMNIRSKVFSLYKKYKQCKFVFYELPPPFVLQPSCRRALMDLFVTTPARPGDIEHSAAFAALLLLRHFATLH